MKKLLITAVLLTGIFFGSVAVAEGRKDAANVTESSESIESINEGEKETAPEQSAEPQESSASNESVEQVEQKKEEETVVQPAKTEETVNQLEKTEPKVEQSEPVEEETEEEQSTVGVKKCSSLSAACRTANFNMTAPKNFAIYKPTEYAAVTGLRVDVLYVNSKNKEEQFTVRKGLGNMDVTEDKENYPIVQFMNDSGILLLVKGTDADLYKVASWMSGDYAYSFESNVGFPKEVLMALVQELY